MFLDKLSILVAIGNTVKSSPGLEQHWMRLTDRASQAKLKSLRTQKSGSLGAASKEARMEGMSQGRRCKVMKAKLVPASYGKW
jgi:hypothetical protein